MSESEHEWFRAQIATYLSQGLSDPNERHRFESHARACEACGEEYARFQQMEGNMSGLFAGAMPDANFEERILGRWRLSMSSHRRKISPLAKKIAIAAAAAVVVGGIGFVGRDFVERGELPQFAMINDRFVASTNLKSIGQAVLPYTNESKWDYRRSGNADASKTDYFYQGDDVVGTANGGTIQGSAGRITGDARLVKIGAGTQQLRSGGAQPFNGTSVGTFGASAPTGALTVSGAGTLLITGSNAVIPGATLTVSDGTLAFPQDQSWATRENYDRNTVRQNASAGNFGGGGGGRGGSEPQIQSGKYDYNSGSQSRTGSATLKLNGASVQMSGDPTANQGTMLLGGIGGGGMSNFKTGSGTVLQNSSTDGPLILHSATPSSYQNLAKLNGAVQLDVEATSLSKDLLKSPAAASAAPAPSFKPSQYAAVVGSNQPGQVRDAGRIPLLGDMPMTSQSGGTFSANSPLIVKPYENGSIVADLPASTSAKPGTTSLGGGGNGFTGKQTVNSGTIGMSGDMAERRIQPPQYAQASDLQTGIPRDVALRLAQESQAATQPARGGGTNAAPVVAPSTRHVIRSGSMEFEVDSYDSAYVTISKVAAEEGGFVEAADSDKLPNGKVRGSVTVRVPPDNLDTLVMKLRALGELKNQKLGSTDIGKEYTDLESELRAARAMEERLIDMIKKANGKVADLLEAEKELGNWRTKIEKIQGQLNYYNNLTSMATLTISAYEKDIRTPASANEVEEINAGVETEDVEAARAAAIKAIDDVKGRIVESSLQKLEAGQFAAKIVAEVAPENAGPLVDRLKQLGRVARLDIQRKQTTDNAKAQAVGQPPTHVEQAPTRLIISMYNLANVAPRLTTNLNLAGDDVEAIYRAILKRVADVNGRVISSNLNRQDATQVVGAMQFEIKAADADAVLNDIRTGANVLRYTVTENPDTANVTTAKQAFVVQVIPLAQVAPRLTTNLNLAASDVETSYRAILKRVADAGGRVISSNLNRSDATQAVGSIQFELKAEQADAVRNDITKGVQVLQMTVNENPDTANVTTVKQVFVVQIIPTSQVAPREVRGLAVETSEVEKAMQNLTGAVASAGGRTIESSLTQDANGRMLAHLSVEVPLDKADGLVDVAKQQGKVRTSESTKNAQVPEGPLARARLNLTIGSGETIVAAEDGFWPRLRQGLSTSMNGLLWSFELIVIGLCLIGPWALLLWGGWRFLRRKKQTV